MGRPPDIEKQSIEELTKLLTPEERDFISLVREGRSDPVAFSEKLLDVPLHEGQKLWLWMTTKTQREKAFELGLKLGKWKSRDFFDKLITRNPEFLKNILVPSNRWGKTLVTSVKHLWYNYYKKGVRGAPKEKAEVRCGTLNISPHSNQCDAGFQYIIDILSSRFVYHLDGISKKNACKISDFLVRQIPAKRKILFKNGTSYIAVPTGEDQASSLAGTPYLYISYDECAQSLHLRAELPAKVMSRLIDYGGPLDLISTPEVDKPSHQYFFRIAKLGLKGFEGWFTMIGAIQENIFLGEVERDRTLASIKSTNPQKYRQVAYGEFVTTGKKMFDNLIIERIWDGFQNEDVKNGMREPEVFLDHPYLICADWGFADGGDPTVFYVLDFFYYPLIKVAHREDIKGGSPFAVLTRAKMLQRLFNGAEFIHDSSALGGTMIKKMLKELELHDLIDFNASGGNKSDMLFTFLVVLTAGRNTTIDAEKKVTDLNPDFGNLRSFLIEELEEQLGNYQYNPAQGITDKKIPQDDVMALGMGIWYIERKFNKQKPKAVAFNPLAPKVSQIFSESAAKELKVKTLVLTEKRIL